jgi:virginiamycin B lyase
MRKGCLAIACLFALGTAQGQKMADGKGKDIVEAACDGCHGLDQIAGRAWSEAKWRDVLKKMIDKGAILSDEEFKTVVDYLIANYGEKSGKPK